MKHFAANSEDIKTQRGTRIFLQGEEIVLFKVEEKIIAVLNMCPHQKFQKLHDGMFENGIVTCPMHGWSYDVRTGFSTNASGRLKQFPVEISNGKVFVEIDDAFSF
ncbi:MAG: Rieske 2Fe-2S domain-containing protein [Bacteroidota bacterium]|jgi:nitrite reductase/ring-hydroxylating ferredoxin subunit